MQSCNLTSKLKENLTVSDVYRFIFVDTPTTHLIHVSSYIWATIFKNEAQVRVKLEQKSDEHLWTETTSFHWTRYLCIRSSNIPLSFSYQWLQIRDLSRDFKTLWMECCIIRISMQNILFIYASRDYQNCTWTPPILLMLYIFWVAPNDSSCLMWARADKMLDPSCKLAEWSRARILGSGVGKDFGRVNKSCDPSFSVGWDVNPDP